MLRAVLLACLAIACAEARTRAPAAVRVAAGPSTSVRAPGGAAPAGADEGWARSLRAADYPGTLRALDALPEARASQPEVRYVRARVRMAMGDFEGASGLLGKLDQELPAIAPRIARDRAECALAKGPFEDAARFFEASGDPASLTKAALALERGGKPLPARALLDRALRAVGAEGDTELGRIAVAARSLRATVAASAGDVATSLADLRWLSVEAPATEEGRLAAKELGRRSPPVSLTPDERLSRSRNLAEAGLLTDALAELAELEKTPGSGVSPVVILRARARAHYLARTSYAAAAELYEEASRAGGAEAAHDAFYSARALSRAQEDARAIERYEAVAVRFASSEFAEEARYQSARLRLLLGHFDDAIAAYERYFARYGARGGGRFRAAATYELSLAELCGKHGDRAARRLRALAEAATEPLERAALEELEGAALATAGDRAGAVERLGGVIRAQPLTFPALASAARLAAIGAPIPSVSRDAGVGPVREVPVELPGDVALLSRLGFDRDAEQALEARESEVVARYAPRGYQALCAAYGKIGAGAARYRAGRAAVKKETFQKLPTDDTRWAWDCVYPEPWGELVKAAEEKRGLPPGLVHSVMRQESGFRTDVVSPASAVGLLQLIPATAERAAREIGMTPSPDLLTEPFYNVELGAYYLHRVLTLFGGDVAVAAAAYNAGPKAVARWLGAGESLPLDVWVARIPYLETRAYVSRVIGNMARYAYLRGGPAEVPTLSLELPRGTRVTDDDY